MPIEEPRDITPMLMELLDGLANLGEVASRLKSALAGNAPEKRDPHGNISSTMRWLAEHRFCVEKEEKDPSH